MSKINGDRSRANRQRKKKIADRVRNRALRAELEGAAKKSKPAGTASKAVAQ